MSSIVRPSVVLRFLGLGSCILAWSAPAGSAQAHAAGGADAIRADVASSRISPDGARVVYLADAKIDETFELFGVPITGGPSRRLNVPPVAGGDVTVYAISPDSRRVAYLGDLDTDQVFELYAASIASRPPVKLNPALVTGGDVQDFAVSPDSQRVVFRADAEGDDVVELYSAPLAGGPAVKLNVPLSAAGGVEQYGISDNGARVVYRSGVASTYEFDLYSVPIGGGPSVQLNTPLGPDDYLDRFLLGSTGHVVYLAHDGSEWGMFAVPILGGDAIELDSGFIYVHSVRLHPDGERVLHIGSRPPLLRDEFFSVSIEGGPPVALNAPLPDEEKVNEFQLSADGKWAVYYVESGDAHMGLSSVNLQRGGVVELTRPGDGRFLISPDSKRVLFVDTTDPVFGLWSIPIGGGPPTPVVCAPLDTSSISPDSKWVVYRSAGSNPSSHYQLYSVPLIGGPSVQLNPPPATNGGVLDAEVSSDSKRVVYRAYQDANDVVELFAVPIGGGPAVQLNPEFHSVP